MLPTALTSAQRALHDLGRAHTQVLLDARAHGDRALSSPLSA
jgi:hypothetical protein